MITENPIQLIEKIVSKDRGCFERFYDHFSPLVYSLALRILRNKSEAEELVQDVFYEVWDHADRYKKERGSLEAWLFTMTRSRAIDRIRSIKRKTRNTSSLDDLPEGMDGAFAQGSKAEESLAKITLQSILGSVSEIQRKALELAYFEGLTHSEIAVRLGVPLGTIKTRIRDGLKSLREILKTKEKSGTA